MQVTPVNRSSAWRPQGADLYSTGASGTVPVRPINPANAVESTDRLGEGAIVREPDKPSAPDLANRDWTVVEEKKQVEEVEGPPKEPISKQLIEHLELLRYVAAMAVKPSQTVSEADELVRNQLQAKDESSVDSAPKVKRTGEL